MKNLRKKIFIWSPMLSNVGTNTAMYGIAESLKKYSNCEVYYLDILGEFSDFKEDGKSHLKFLKINHLVPNTGKFSKFIIIFFSILSLPFLIMQIFLKKPDTIITGLVGFVPSITKIFFPKIKIINSIQGYPKLNFLRKIIWKIFYANSDYIITMTNKTKKLLQEKLSISEHKILVIENPVISRKIRKLANSEIDDKDKIIFRKDVYCSIGRLTRQKNFFELMNFIKDYENKNTNFIIIGSGEQKNKIKEFIEKNKIDNCYLLGFKKNPYNYLSRSKLYISTSLWEEPGHTLLEAGYLNIPILSSNCPNGPDEIIQNKFNGLKYTLGNKTDFIKKLKDFKELSDFKKKEITINMKKNVMNYTQFRFCKKFSKILELNC